ncbi:hypothetical protein Rhopal_003898-T1 [Rhodotorula paludigena]|uniref:Cyclin N-terminal domain-containing protein n=1 Tax=Rhodotorula paludigena TaxID=86838 RepID=A0AAV5GLU6_9BASI|nr:hypothetical protein Rhopal_003898-T1 [Rhodotorula paludigena]
MNAPTGYPSFDGSAHHAWTMVAPQQQHQHQQYYYGGAHYDPVRAHVHHHHQASLLQVAQQQHAAATAAAYPAYNPAAYAHGQQQPQPYYPSSQPLQLDGYYAAQQAQPAPFLEQAVRSRFAFATPTHAPLQPYEQQRGFTLPPPAPYAASYGMQAHQADAMRAAWDARTESTAAYGRAESAARATLENEYDHPSHSRPPHRGVATADAMLDDDSVASQQQHVTYDLIPNVSSVPPPPPVERSAVPLADLATEMVWETVRRGYLHVVETSAPANQGVGVIGQPARAGPRRSGGAEQFGIIGDRRAFAGNDFEATARMQRLADLGFSAQRAASASAAFPVEPSSAFRAFVKQILTATLVTPEDLVFALYLVSQVPVDKLIPSTPAERGQDAQTTSFKAAPFKMVLGALMIANKQLQDNSYRNDTFSTVSGIPLADVNALEAHVATALLFDVAIREDKWLVWLGVVAERFRAGTGQLGDRLAVQEALARLIVAAQQSCEQPAIDTAPSTPALSASDSASSLASLASAATSLLDGDCAMAGATCPSTPPAGQSHLADVNLDASGPLESPLHFDPAAARRRAAFKRAASSLASSVAASSMDSPLLAATTAAAAARQQRSCVAASATESSGYSLFPPVDLAAARSRSFGQETWSRAIC